MVYGFKVRFRSSIVYGFDSKVDRDFWIREFTRITMRFMTSGIRKISSWLSVVLIWRCMPKFLRSRSSLAEERFLRSLVLRAAELQKERQK